MRLNFAEPLSHGDIWDTQYLDGDPLPTRAKNGIPLLTKVPYGKESPVIEFRIDHIGDCLDKAVLVSCSDTSHCPGT